MNNHRDGAHPALVSDNVTKAYPRTVALSSVSLVIEKGEKVAIVGPSGAGKTTLLHLFGGVIQPDRGRIWIHGRLLSALSPGRELASLVGIIHQQFDLVPHLLVAHNVLAGRLGHWTLLRSLVSLISPRDRHLAMEALNKVGIADKAHERTSRLSGGEQQRVAVARLLVQNPSIILADEPVASVDPARAEDLLRLISDVVRDTDKTLVASLHTPDMVRKYFSRVVGVRNGDLQFDVPVGEMTEGMLERLYELKGLKGEVQTEVH
jgi:phosphonate transport system ATP-binding protein